MYKISCLLFAYSTTFILNPCPRFFFFFHSTPLTQKGGRGIFSKLWPKRSKSVPNAILPYSQSWDSSFSRPDGFTPYDEEYPTEDDVVNEEELPEPPPTPTVEYLLGKRVINKRNALAEKTKSVENDMHDTEDYDSDSHSSAGSSRRGHHKKKRKRRKSPNGDARDDSVQWQYNKLAAAKSGSLTERKSLGKQRQLTPIPSQVKTPFLETMPRPLKLDFDSAVSREIEQAALSSSPETPSSLSPLHSPSPISSLSPTSPMSSKEASPAHTYHRVGEPSRPIRAAPPPPTVLQSKTVQPARNVSKTPPANTGSTQPKRPAPKLPPHLQNRQNKQQIAQENANAQNPARNNPMRKAAPIAKIANSRNKSGQQGNAPKQGVSPTSPNEFMANLNKAISSSPKQPKVMRQASQDDSSSPPGTHSPTTDQIEQDLNAMFQTILTSSTSTTQQRLPSPETPRAVEGERDALTSDSEESSEYTSSSDDSSTSDTEDTSSESSTEDEKTRTRPLSTSPRRPIMARNIGMASPRGKGFGGFNRTRLMLRYPRLLRKVIVRLDTINEVPEELIHQAVSLW